MMITMLLLLPQWIGNKAKLANDAPSLYECFFTNECFFMNECCLWMNEWFNEWIIQCMLLLLSWYKFSVEIMQDSDAFYECVTRLTDQPTDQPTDTAYYRDARTHLKRTATVNLNVGESKRREKDKAGLIAGCSHLQSGPSVKPEVRSGCGKRAESP